MNKSPLLVSAALLTASLGAQTVVNTITHSGSFAGGVCYDPIRDEVCVIDSSTDSFTFYDRTTGTQLRQIAAPTTIVIGGFIDPATGNLWVGDEGEIVYEMDRGGNILRQWSTQPAVGDVSALTWDPFSDTLWVSNDSAQFIQEFDKNGNPLTTVSVSGAGSADPDGLTYDPFSRVFLLGEDTGDQVIVVDRTGALITSFGTSTLGISPEGLATDTRTGSLFIANTSGTPDTVVEVAGILSPPQSGAVSTYGTGCAPGGGTVPLIHVSDPIRVGSGFSFSTYAPQQANTVTALNLGASRSSIPLDPFGATGCTMYAAPTLASLAASRNANGYFGATVPVPNAPALINFRLTFWAIDFQAPNVLGATGGVEAVIQQ